MQHRPIDSVTLAAFLVAVLMLGANWVGVRSSNRELPPFWGAALRFAVAAAVLCGIVGHLRDAPLWTLFLSAAAGFERVRAMNIVGCARRCRRARGHLR